MMTNVPPQPPKAGTITMEDLLARVPELVRRKQQATALRGTMNDLKDLGSRDGLGNYVPTQHGGLYQTVAKHQYDWKKAGNEIVSAGGQLYYGGKANDAERDLQEFTGQQTLESAQQMSGGGENPTAQTLRQYLGMLTGNPDSVRAPHVASTQVTQDGQIYTIMSDGTPNNTGLIKDYNTRILEDGAGGVLSIGPSGAGRGQAAPVVTGQPVAGQNALPAPATNTQGQTINVAGQPVVIGDDVPEEVRRMILQDPTSGMVEPPPQAFGPGQNVPAPAAPAAAPASAAPAPLNPVPAPGNPARVLSPAEIEADKVRARTQAEAQVSPVAARTAADLKLAEESAKLQAEARANLGKTKTAATNVIAALSGLRTSRGLDSIIGGSLWSRVPDGITNIALPIFQAGTPAADALAKFNELRGANFMQAFETLKGGGQITEQEGLKAEAAYARLQRSQTREEFLAALAELEQFAEDAVARAEAAAAGNFSGPAAPAAPAPAPKQFNLPAGWSVEVR